VLASIPYETFPELPLGLNTFGVMVALGVLVGMAIGAGYGRRFDVAREDTYRIVTVMVLAGLVGARLTWVLTHTDEIDDPLDVVALWEGGIELAAGSVVALLVGLPTFLRWSRARRWHVLNGYAWGLTVAAAFGRVGAYGAGEHFGRTTDFFLGTRYEGGDTLEPCLGGDPDQLCAGGTRLREGLVFHNTALYEVLWLAALFVLMGLLVWRARRKGRHVLPVTLVALFLVTYGVARFLTDTLRVNDERLLTLTVAQWMCIAMFLYGAYLWFRTRPAVRKLVDPSGRLRVVAAGPAAGLLADDPTDDDEETVPVAPDELAPPEDDPDHESV
jgi:phosphatidylglycerol---prolipoprotein diacylglyceryl transferase